MPKQRWPVSAYLDNVCAVLAMTRRWGALLISVGQTSAVMVKDIVSVPGSGPSITQAPMPAISTLSIISTISTYLNSAQTNPSYHTLPDTDIPIPHTSHVITCYTVSSIFILISTFHIHIFWDICGGSYLDWNCVYFIYLQIRMLLFFLAFCG